jgi:hypothetical protein
MALAELDLRCGPVEINRELQLVLPLEGKMHYRITRILSIMDLAGT